MKYYVLAALSVLVLLFSCNSSNNTVQLPVNTLLRPDQMPVEEFTINIDRDTVLETKNGALLRIPAGALSSPDKNVTLQVKDAFSLSQMIAAGLTTRAGNDLLASDGMIFIGPKAGQDVTINKGIDVAIPSKAKSPDMQLFTGKENADGSIDWTDPVDLTKSKKEDTLARGARIFQSKCAGCHAIGKQLETGPDLAHFPKRIPLSYGEGQHISIRYWIHDFNEWYHEDEIRSDRLDAYRHSDLYACNLSKMFGGPVDLSSEFYRGDAIEDSMFAVYDYIQSESDRNNLPYPQHAWLLDCVDSCRLYNEGQAVLKELDELARLQAERKQSLSNKTQMVEEINDRPVIQSPNPPPSAPAPPIDYDDKVNPPGYASSYYQFTIVTFGWSNIDVLIKKRNGVEESELFIRITGEYVEKVQVYLIIPSVKIYVQGGPSSRDGYIAFQYKNGKIDLPQNTRAFIMAVTEVDASVAYTVKEFTTSTQLELDISLTKATKEEFNRAIRIIGGDNISVIVEDSKQSKELRAIDQQLIEVEKEKQKIYRLRPKNCDCDCNYGVVGDTANAVKPIVDEMIGESVPVSDDNTTITNNALKTLSPQTSIISKKD
jgi:hypothetical protein